MITLSLRAPKRKPCLPAGRNLFLMIASSLSLYVITISGCQTAPKQATPKPESTQEVISALGTVAEGLTNQPLTEEGLKKLAVQVQKDPEAQSALKAVNQALGPEQVGVKYCPHDGKRFSSRLKNCPDCGAELKDVE